MDRAKFGTFCSLAWDEHLSYLPITLENGYSGHNCSQKDEMYTGSIELRLSAKVPPELLPRTPIDLSAQYHQSHFSAITRKVNAEKGKTISTPLICPTPSRTVWES